MIVLTPEDHDLVQVLASLKEADFAKLVGLISPETRDQIRSILGLIKVAYESGEELNNTEEQGE